MRMPLVCVFALGLSIRPADAAGEAQRCADRARDGEIVDCLAALAADPHDLVARRHLAFAYLARNDPDRCFAVHREIVVLAPDDASAWLDYAVAAATFWDYATAVEPIRTALRLAPDDRIALRVAAIVFRMAGLPHDALAAMHHGAELGDDLQMAALAYAYRHGFGTAPEIGASAFWLTRAAARGHVGAMEDLAELYRHGADGIPADPMAAAAWAERARRAAAGD